VDNVVKKVGVYTQLFWLSNTNVGAAAVDVFISPVELEYVSILNQFACFL
jgi:hypothetical protein